MTKFKKSIEIFIQRGDTIIQTLNYLLSLAINILENNYANSESLNIQYTCPDELEPYQLNKISRILKVFQEGLSLIIRQPSAKTKIKSEIQQVNMNLSCKILKVVDCIVKGQRFNTEENMSVCLDILSFDFTRLGQFYGFGMLSEEQIQSQFGFAAYDLFIEASTVIFEFFLVNF